MTNESAQVLENLRYYIQSAEPPKEACKPFHNGRFNGTDISPMWRIKQLTALFGPCGVGWYTEVTKREILAFDATTQKAFVDINLYIRDPVTGEWSKPIQGTGGNTWVGQSKDGKILANDECYKMAETDALGSACKKLGFGAQIYWSQDKTKYTVTDEDMEDTHVSNRERLAKQAQADPFLSKPEPTEEDRNIAKAEECREAILDFVTASGFDLPQIIVDYATQYGRVDTWDSGIAMRVYKELKAEGHKLKEVAL